MRLLNLAARMPRARAASRLTLGFVLVSALLFSAVPGAQAQDEAYLTIVKMGPATATAGQTITYVISVRNAGDTPAYDAFVEDYGRAPVSLATANASQGSCSIVNNSVLCSLGTIEPDASVTVTLTARVTHAGPADNVASTRAQNASSILSNTVRTQIEPAAPAQPVVTRPVADNAHIRGTVFKAGRRQKPMKKVVVCASRGDKKVCSNPTGRDGSFAISGIQPGSYTISASPRRGGCWMGSPISRTSDVVLADPAGQSGASIYCGRGQPPALVTPQDSEAAGCPAGQPAVPAQPAPAPSGNSFTQTDPNGTQKEWLDKLLKDVTETGIDQKPYVADEPGPDENYDCDDFAGDLEKALEAKDYKATFTLIWCPGEAHAATDVHAPDGSVVWIEPQTAKRITDMDKNGDGKVGYDSTVKKPAMDNPTEGDCRVEVYDSRAAAEDAGRTMDR